jgi:ubiquinone biosynthesis protein
VGRRVLGVPVGWPRSIFVWLMVLAAMNVVLPWMADRAGIRTAPVDLSTGLAAALLFLLVLGWLFFLGIAFLVALELIVPTGSIPTPWQLVRGIRARNRRTKRYLKVLAIAVRHGLGGLMRRSSGRTRPAGATQAPALARSLRGALNDGGVTFTKIGQLLSTRPDLIGPGFAGELSQLQTSSSPVAWDQLEPLVVTAVGRPTEEVFTQIDREPLATASVAQVHTARLADGAAVVIKVQKPAARAQVEADLDIVGRLADRLERSTAWGGRWASASSPTGSPPR